MTEAISVYVDGRGRLVIVESISVNGVIAVQKCFSHEYLKHKQYKKNLNNR